jgi:hypothetical protein
MIQSITAMKGHANKRAASFCFALSGRMFLIPLVTQDVALGYYVRCAFSAHDRGSPCELKTNAAWGHKSDWQIPTALL